MADVLSRHILNPSEENNTSTAFYSSNVLVLEIPKSIFKSVNLHLSRGKSKHSREKKKNFYYRYKVEKSGGILSRYSRGPVPFFNSLPLDAN